MADADIHSAARRSAYRLKEGAWPHLDDLLALLPVLDAVAAGAKIMTEQAWFGMETAPTDGRVVEGRWPGFGKPDKTHQGRMFFAEAWYTLGKAILYKGWWSLADDGSKGPTALPPTEWRHLTP